MTDYFSVAEVRAAACTLEPMKCIFCGSMEVTYHNPIGDAYCADCGTWQDERL
jgi:hypothetical protein